jgi:hypothetical protein
MEFIHNYFLVNQEVDLKTILDESTTYVKKATVLTQYPLSNDLSYSSTTFYTKTAEPITLHVSTENENLIHKILDYWTTTHNNLNALQSGYVIFESHGLPCLVFSNSELHTSSHSYCQIIKLDLMTEKYLATDKKQNDVRLNCYLLIVFLFLLFTIFIIVM